MTLQHQTFYKSPEVSIIIPAHRNEDLLTTLITLRNQTFKDFEIIIKYDNEGYRQASLRNEGAEQAKGKYILFSDGDIFWYPNAVEIMYKTLLSMNDQIDVAYVYSKFMSNGQPAGKEYDVDSLKVSNFISTNSMFIKLDFLKIGGFDETLKRWEDWDLFLNLNKHDYRGAFIPLILFETGGLRPSFFNNLDPMETKKIVQKKYGL